MEHNRKVLKASRTFLFETLRQELEDQSDACDVTIKIGSWMKKYHWPVLVRSPFFDAIYRNHSYVEYQTGIIELHAEHLKTVVEDTLLYLYGWYPNITIDNVSGLLEMAEFLLLPSLKTLCLNWLQDATVSCDNAFHVLQLATLFDIYLPSLEKFIEGNLNTLLEKGDAVSLDKNSIIELLNDHTLSYITVKEWFRFLVRWGRDQPGRTSQFKELLYHLDLSEVDEPLKQEMCSERLVTRLRLNMMLEQIKPTESLKVCIFPNIIKFDFCFAVQIERARWFKISRESMVMDAVKDTFLPSVQVTGRNTLTYCDLTSQGELIAETIVLSTDDGKNYAPFKNEFALVKSTCYIKETKFDKYNDVTPSRFVEKTTLYKAQVVQGRKQTIIEPMVCLKSEPPSLYTMAVDMQHNIALCSRDQNIVVYNHELGQQEQIKIGCRSTHKATLISLNCGFAFVTDTHICCILARQEESSRGKFEPICVELMPDASTSTFGGNSRYLACGDICFRFSRSELDEDYTFSFVNIKKRAEERQSSPAKWISIPLPNNHRRDILRYVDTTARFVPMPKHMLKCTIDCAHCAYEMKKKW